MSIGVVAYNQWKKHTPLLYDMLISHNLSYPSPCLRWGHIVSEDNLVTIQRIYYSERGAAPNSIVAANVKIPKPRTTDPGKIDKFEENAPNPSVAALVKIETPQHTEVNKLYTFERERWALIAKSDLSKLHIWNVQSASADPRPCATLAGHRPDACESNFALDTSGGRVISGDRDGAVLLWDLGGGTNTAGPGCFAGDHLPLRRYEGHTKTVEDVCFNPATNQQFCSVGDDGVLAFWDERAGASPVTKVPPWCQVDLHCVDWNAVDENLLVTGTADGATFVFDRRQVMSALHKLRGHKEPVFRVGWRPNSTQHFASGGEDAHLLVWDIAQAGPGDVEQRTDSDSTVCPPGVILHHSGHRGSVQDLQWNPYIPWVVASVSEDAQWAEGGGTLQIWRPLDLLFRSDDDCLAELRKFQDDLRGAAAD